jgi:uncharacterized protein with HEPN domain
MPLSDLDFIKHIRDEALYLNFQISQLTFDFFKQDQTFIRAFVRSLEVIGEASKKISSEFKKKYPDIDWRAMAGMRDKLIHDYFGVDYEIVWDVIKNEIPKLLKLCTDIINNEGKK